MRRKDPLRALNADEVSVLRHLSRSSREPAVVEGATYTAAAQAAGRRSRDAVGRPVAEYGTYAYV